MTLEQRHRVGPDRGQCPGAVGLQNPKKSAEFFDHRVGEPAHHNILEIHRSARRIAAAPASPCGAGAQAPPGCGSQRSPTRPELGKLRPHLGDRRRVVARPAPAGNNPGRQMARPTSATTRRCASASWTACDWKRGSTKAGRTPARKNQLLPLPLAPSTNSPGEPDFSRRRSCWITSRTSASRPKKSRCGPRSRNAPGRETGCASKPCRACSPRPPTPRRRWKSRLGRRCARKPLVLRQASTDAPSAAGYRITPRLTPEHSDRSRTAAAVPRRYARTLSTEPSAVNVPVAAIAVSAVVGSFHFAVISAMNSRSLLRPMTLCCKPGTSYSTVSCACTMPSPRRIRTGELRRPRRPTTARRS